MDPDYPPTPAETPTALAECPHCGGSIHVVLRDRPPIAFPVGTITTPKTQPKHCPHCGIRLWIALRPRAPVAMPAKGLTIALREKENPFPTPKGNAQQTDTTKVNEIEPPPPT